MFWLRLREREERGEALASVMAKVSAKRAWRERRTRILRLGLLFCAAAEVSARGAIDQT